MLRRSWRGRWPTRSFNRITIDGDTSTNDSFMLIATGAGSLAVDSPTAPIRRAARRRTDVSRQLAQAIVRDGEGATKFITITVEGGASVEECRKVAYAIAHSPLVKTAFFASDPNLGRILAAVGYAGIDDLDSASSTCTWTTSVVAKTAAAIRLPGRGRPARDEAERDHGARRPRPRRRRRHGVDLRPVARLRDASTPTTARERHDADLEQFLRARRALLARLEGVLPHPLAAPDWNASIAFRYRKRGGRGSLEPVRHVRTIRLATCRTSSRRRSGSCATPSSSSPARRPTTCC